MDTFSPYIIIIASSLVIIISYFFNIISRKTNIPSVLLLIVLGIIIKEILSFFAPGEFNWFPILEILGIVGLIMIVLESALELELKKDKLPMILKSLGLAILSLGVSSFIIGLLLQYLLNIDLFIAMLYSTPLSIMSSAIIIPSVYNLQAEKKEFMIYESTFSDILGIMLFYFLLGSIHAESTSDLGIGIILNISGTILLSIIFSYAIAFLFQNIKTEIKLFLLIAVLLLLYAIGKMFHLSSLLLILVFGLVLKNRNIFIRGFLTKYINKDSLASIHANFHLITIESSFVIRTFFFVIFGITISLASLFRLDVIFPSIMILIILYAVRYLFVRIFIGKNILPLLFIAPRGLITILLFFAIPQEFQVAEFKSDILLIVIIVTSSIMAWTLIKDAKRTKLEASELKNTINTDNSDIGKDSETTSETTNEAKEQELL